MTTPTQEVFKVEVRTADLWLVKIQDEYLTLIYLDGRYVCLTFINAEEARDGFKAGHWFIDPDKPAGNVIMFVKVTDIDFCFPEPR